MPNLGIPSIPDAFLWPGDSSKPVIITLHGLGGNRTHMLGPESTGANFDYTGAPPSPPASIPVGTFGTPPPPWPPSRPTPDAFKSVRSWKQFLNVEHAFPVVTYSQTAPGGRLGSVVAELATLITALNASALVPVDAKYVLLAHSRGGLLARSYIKTNFATPALVGRIIKVVTLCSPHQGSAWVGLLAGDATTLAAMIAALGGVSPGLAASVTTALAPVFAFLRPGTGRAQLAIGSPFLTSLAAGELPLPGVQYHTFGGTSIRGTRVWDWAYSWTSWLPTPTVTVTIGPGGPAATSAVTYTWSVAPPAEDWTASPLAEKLHDVLPPSHQIPEITSGTGDILVADARARLPFATHHTLPVNHGEALWDPTMQEQVLSLLEDGTWRAWGTFDGAGLRQDPLLVRDESHRLALFAYTDQIIRQRREIAAGDPVPPGTLSPGPGGANGWTNWVDLPDAFPRPVAAAFDAMSDNGVAIPGRLHLFGLKGDTIEVGDYGARWNTVDLETRFRATGPDDWWVWQTLGGTVWNSRPDPPYSDAYYYVESTLKAGPVVVRDAQGQLEVFAVGGPPSGDAPEIFHLRQLLPVDSADWNHWGSWVKPGLPCAGVFTASVNLLGQVELYLQDAAGVVHLHRRLAPDSEWQEWAFAPEPVMGPLAVGTDGVGTTWVFAVGLDGLLYWARPKAGLVSQLVAGGMGRDLVLAVKTEYEVKDLQAVAAGSLAAAFGGGQGIRGRVLWTGWTPEPGTVGAGGLSVASNADGRIEIFARSADGHVMHMTQSTVAADSATFSPWLPLGGIAQSRPAAGIRADGRLVVVALGDDGVLRQRVQFSPGTW